MMELTKEGFQYENEKIQENIENVIDLIYQDERS